MKTVRVKVAPDKLVSTGRIDAVRVDATNDVDIARQIAADGRAAAMDAAHFARQIRKRPGSNRY